MRWSVFFCLSLSMTMACSEPRPSVPKQQNILLNLPVNDRDLLLQPLERALDDLRSNIEANSAFSSASVITVWNGIDAVIECKYDGEDTLLLRAVLKHNDDVEKHEWFFDEQGFPFYSFHELRSSETGVIGEEAHEAYCFYFEKGQQLSAYGKFSQGDKLPEQWTPVCLPGAREEVLQGRKHLIRKLLSEA